VNSFSYLLTQIKFMIITIFSIEYHLDILSKIILI